MSEDNLIEASPCKLRNGNWGCKTQEPVDVGDTVRIVTRANKQWRAEITQIVWTDDQLCICETASENSKAPSASQAESGKRAGAGRPGTPSPQPLATAAQSTPDAPPPRADESPTDELDAMADRAAERDDDFDDLMSTIQELERDRSRD
ncbi:hypothetical protein [Salinisphaera sp.]|uniref:hypothetical protein n=1 Tax=Salinisphaera sp. TaxID=1914330 RepID=UPI002D799215|nr:hypothetical protein [Salinisphaera sp.]HET7314190.1 hypothetical protein [Salinisphaera sp.]